MNKLLIVVALVALNLTAEIKPWAENPWYWSYAGKPVLLLGGSDDDNLFQWPADKLVPLLDRLAAAGGNVIRNTMSDRNDKDFEVYAYEKRADGKYDLNIWNDLYWARFERMLKETAKRRIFVQIEVWDRFDYTDCRGSNRWQIHPYNPANNINYTYNDSGLDAKYPDHPGSNKQPFFFSTPGQRNNRVLLPYQQRFVKKMLEHTLRFDHVLYCMDNETKGEEEWGRYWAKFVKSEASKKKKRVYVTEMWDDWNLAAEQHKRTFDHPELYDFVDVSQNNHNKGEKHWNNFIHVQKYLSKKPRPINTTKTYGADGNKFGHSDQDAVERFWRHLLAGAASMRFHRPPSGLGLNDKAVGSIRAARKLESKIPLWGVSPAKELVSECGPNEAYAAIGAEEGAGCALYFPAGGEVIVDLSGMKGALSVHWIDVMSGEWGPVESVAGGRKVKVAPPDKGNWAAAITCGRTNSNVEY